MKVEITIEVPITYDYDPGAEACFRGHPDTWTPPCPDSLEIFLDISKEKLYDLVSDEIEKDYVRDYIYRHIEDIQNDIY